MTSLLGLSCKMSYDANDNAEDRRQAILALRKASDSASLTSLLQAAQQDPDPELRESAVVGLGQRGDPGAVEGLGNSARQDDNVHVRRRAVEALGLIPDAKAAQTLAELWRPGPDQKSQVFNLAVQDALVQLGTLAVPALITSLQHSSYHVRWKATDALGRIGDPGAISPLKALLADPNPTVQDAVRRAIEKLTAQTKP